MVAAKAQGLLSQRLHLPSPGKVFPEDSSIQFNPQILQNWGWGKVLFCCIPSTCMGRQPTDWSFFLLTWSPGLAETGWPCPCQGGWWLLLSLTLGAAGCDAPSSLAASLYGSLSWCCCWLTSAASAASEGIFWLRCSVRKPFRYQSPG